MLTRIARFLRRNALVGAAALLGAAFVFSADAKANASDFGISLNFGHGGSFFFASDPDPIYVVPSPPPPLYYAPPRPYYAPPRPLPPPPRPYYAPPRPLPPPPRPYYAPRPYPSPRLAPPPPGPRSYYSPIPGGRPGYPPPRSPRR